MAWRSRCHGKRFLFFNVSQGESPPQHTGPCGEAPGLCGRSEPGSLGRAFTGVSTGTTRQGNNVDWLVWVTSEGSGPEEWSPVVWYLVPGELGQLACEREVDKGCGWGVDLGLVGLHVEGGSSALCYLPLRMGSLWERQSLPGQQDFKDVKTS